MEWWSIGVKGDKKAISTANHAKYAKGWADGIDLFEAAVAVARVGGEDAKCGRGVGLFVNQGRLLIKLEGE
jgi:hypothetical protein